MVLTIPTRIYSQYRGKPRAVAWYNITRTIGGQFADVFNEIRTSYNIDTATTDELNVIGRIVVIDRGYEGQIIFDPIRWGSGSKWGGSGVRYMTPVGAGSLEVSNDIYRILIKAKIAKNNSDATIEGILQSIETITNIHAVSLIDHEDMSFAINFGYTLDSTTRFVLDNFNIIPKTQGVRFAGYTETAYETSWDGLYSWDSAQASFSEV